MSAEIILITDDRYTVTESDDWYIQQILTEDQLLSDALSDLGVSSERRSWSDKDFDWSTAKLLVFRSCWDYHQRFEEFFDWLKGVGTQVNCSNPPSVITWNIDKSYLLDLQARGINTVESIKAEKQSRVDLKTIMSANEWPCAIIKPTISAAARDTFRIDNENIEIIQSQLNSMLKHEAFLIQPFQESILEQGELSLMVMGGQFTHAIRKIAKPGDFRVQDDHGGKVVEHLASKEEIAFAEHVIRACDTTPDYARVDIVRDNQGNLSVMELELFEPELFFRYAPESAGKLAEVLAKRIHQ